MSFVPSEPAVIIGVRQRINSNEHPRTTNGEKCCKDDKLRPWETVLGVWGAYRR